MIPFRRPLKLRFYGMAGVRFVASRDPRHIAGSEGAGPYFIGSAGQNITGYAIRGDQLRQLLSLTFHQKSQVTDLG